MPSSRSRTRSSPSSRTRSRHRVRAQRPPRRDRRHRTRRLQRAVRRADSLHDLQPRAAIHPEHALHDLLPAGGAEISRRTWPRSKQQVAAAGYLALTKEEFIREDLQLLHVSDRHRHQHADHDGDQLHRRTVHLGADLLHLRAREPGEVRRAQGDRRQGPRADPHDPVSGHLRRAHRLRLRRRAVRAASSGWRAAICPIMRRSSPSATSSWPSSWWSSSPRSPATSACARF